MSGVDQAHTLQINVVGPFRLIGANGENLCPRSMKGKVLLLLLAVAPNGERSRSWLQSTIWASRGTQQASDSLRQALTEIRKALGSYGDVLKTDRTAVRLDLSRIGFAYAAPLDSTALSKSQLFEDFKASDDKLSSVIESIRDSFLKNTIGHPEPKPVFTVPALGGYAHDAALCANNVVVIETTPEADPYLHLGAKSLASQIKNSLQEYGDFDILIPRDKDISGVLRNGHAGLKEQICHIRLTTSRVGNQRYLECEVGSFRHVTLSWTGFVHLSDISVKVDENLELLRLANDCSAAICDFFIKQHEKYNFQKTAAIYGQLATSLLFQLDQKSLVNADRLYKRAFEISGAGQYLAWRAFVNLSVRNQHFEHDLLDDDTSTDNLLAEALKRNYSNSSVQAISSQLYLFDKGDVGFANYMASNAFERNPSNPLVCALLSNSMLRSKRFDESYEAAKRALFLSKNQNNHFYFHHFACMSACSAGNYDVALQHAEWGLKLRPDFVSLRRYQIALAVHFGNDVKIQQALRHMLQYEANFSVHNLIKPGYPSPTLQTLPLAEAIAQF